MTLMVTDVDEINGPDWYNYKPDYYPIIGNSCLTPEASVAHVQQYRVNFIDEKDKKEYTLYTVGYDDGSQYNFELGKCVINHVPHLGELFDYNAFWVDVLPESSKPLRIVSGNWCCLPKEDGDEGCHCNNFDPPFTVLNPMLIIKSI